MSKATMKKVTANDSVDLALPPPAETPVIVERPQVPAVSQIPEGSIEATPYFGVASQPVSQTAGKILMGPIDPNDVEIRPDGILYLPEIKYRRILNLAFGPGGWALIPRSGIDMHNQTMSREFALVVGGRFISEARGECDYHESNDQMSYASVVEGVKSSALVRCCKDLGIASELWDPSFIEAWIEKFAVQVWRHEVKKPNWRRKDRKPFWNERGFVQADSGRNDQQAAQRPAPQPRKPPVQRTERHQPTQAHVDLEKALEAATQLDGDPVKLLERVTSYVDGQDVVPGVQEVALLTEQKAKAALVKVQNIAAGQQGQQQGINYPRRLKEEILAYVEAHPDADKYLIMGDCVGIQNLQALGPDKLRKVITPEIAKRGLEKFEKEYQ